MSTRTAFVVAALIATVGCSSSSRPPAVTPPVTPPVVTPTDPPVIDPPALPVPRPDVRWPALCASYYAAVTDPDLDVPAFASWLRGVGATCTRAWLLDAWAVGERDAAGRFKPGQYDGFISVVRLADGRFDLSAWNESYFARLRSFTDTMNAAGVWPHFTVLELYTWSARKAGLPFVPDPNKGPFRNNINGVRWGDPDDATFFSLPDAWLPSFMCKAVATLDGTSYAIELGNEMPERALHFRLRDALKNCGYRGDVTVSRNEDAPGQAFNMQIGTGGFDRLALHGKLSLDYLDEVFEEEAAAGRPTTFRAMWPLVDPARIILSSDGGGGNPAHLDNLRAVACDALRRGASYEHQLALKRRRFFGDGSLQMADLAIDEAMLRSLAACRQ